MLVAKKLRAVGVRVALDDFGTGYSSLTHLKDIAIDCLKIDQSFVAGMGKDRHTSAIVTSLTAMARSLGLQVVGEGVENESHAQALRLAGCGYMQGYFFSRPMENGDLPYQSKPAELVESADFVRRNAQGQ